MLSDERVTLHDPRAERSRASAVSAALQLLQEGGIARLTHQNIARLSGIGRSTVYRHWPTMSALVLELLVEFRMPDFEHIDGTLRDRLRHNIALQQDKLLDPEYISVYLAVQSVAKEDVIKTRLQEINGSRVLSVRDVLRPDFNLEDSWDRITEVLALVNGPLLQMTTFVDAPVGDVLIESVIDAVVSYLQRSTTVA